MSAHGADPANVNLLLQGLLPTGHGLTVVALRPPGGLVCTADPGGLDLSLRGSVSGPTIFKLVDYAAFLTVNHYAGPARSAVLAQSSVSFLEGAEPGELRIEVELVQLGMRSAVAETRVLDQRGWLVTLATLHFALPGARAKAALVDQASETGSTA